MELPQSRPYGNQGGKLTHSFLSLYSPAQQDPSSTPPGGFLETHDFLQPLERIGKNVVKEGNKFEERPAPVEHILPGGVGTYSICHVSSISQSQSQRMPKGEGVVITGAQSSGSDKNEENSNCSSYTGSGFSLWEESAVKNGNTGNENIAGNRRVIKEGGTKTEGVPSMKSMERPSQSSSAHNHPSTTVRSLSFSRPSSAPKTPNFVDMLKSSKSSKEDEDDQEQEFVIKKEPPSHYKDTTHHDQKPNTPRSKHSATEQRRRSKINDRFMTLRELIPHGDQKRDKASFLLEVIEYIRFLKEKVHKYEDSCRNKSNSNQIPTNGLLDQQLVQTSGSEPSLGNMGNASLNHPKKGQTLLHSDFSSGEQIGQHPRLANKGSSFPSPLQSKIYSPGCINTSATAPLLAAEVANTTSQIRQTRSYTNDCTVTASDKLKDQEVTTESGTIRISTIYSQGLLSTLTQALQNSGVDLSQASISVQIDLGKRANPSTPLQKKNEISGIDDTSARSRLASTLEEGKNDSTSKRIKTNRT